MVGGSGSQAEPQNQVILLKAIQELHRRAHSSSRDRAESEHYITCVVSSVLSANRHGMYFNTDLCKLFANTSLRVPKSLKQLGLRTTNGCPWILVDALLRKTFYDSCRSASMGPTSTDSTTVGGDSSEDSQLHIDLSPIVCSS